MGTDRRGETRGLLITGTVGVGKTSVAEAVGGLLADGGLPSAVIDLDWLSQCWPAPPDDRFNSRLMLRNLRCVARNYLDMGVGRLVLAGVIEGKDDRQRCADAVGVDLSVVRLQAELPVVRRRLRDRHENEPEALRWHLNRSGELAAILDRARVEDIAIDVTTRSITEVAEAVVESTGMR